MSGIQQMSAFRSPHGFLQRVLLLLAVSIGSGPVLSADPPPPADAQVSEAPTSQPSSRSSRSEERQIKAISGLAALAGIVIAGLALGALIILWAGRLRRQLRQPPRDTVPGSDFWFLKPPKPPVSDAAPSAPPSAQDASGTSS